MHKTLRIIAVLTLGVSLTSAQPPPPMQQGDGIWIRNAGFGELHTFDSCNGHQPQDGTYHHHVNPVCLRLQLNDNVEIAHTTRALVYHRETAAPWNHSPILGWMSDGYPVYGPYGYADSKDPASPVRRMRSGFRLRNITTRTTLPDWALSLHPGVNQQLTPSQFGPEINALFPLGRYQEDYEWSASSGDLDVHNGRTTVTPEFPNGTYAYFITIAEDGTPEFPYIVGAQYYGTVSGGQVRGTVTGTQDYFKNGAYAQPESKAPGLASWLTQNSQQAAKVKMGYDPSAEAKDTWPTDLPAGARANGGVSTATFADIQQIRESGSAVFVNASGLASYVMGPWFDMLQPGGVFGGLPSNQNFVFQVPKNPSVAQTKSQTRGGPVGVWVNGVAIFNTIDGGSYSRARSADVGGGFVSPTTVNVSTASMERGPFAPGSLVTAFPFFGSTVATATAAAEGTEWPTALGGTTVSIRDSAGAVHAARISSVSPSQITYQIPENAATGFARVTVSVGNSSSDANIQIDATYPHLFFADAEGIASGQFVRVRRGQQTVEPFGLIDLGSSADQVFAVLYGSGLGKASEATATIAGITANVVNAGPKDGAPGVDEYRVLIPRSVAGRGRLDVVIRAGGRTSNSVNLGAAVPLADEAE